MKAPLNMRVQACGLVVNKGEVLLIEYYQETQGLYYVLPGGAVLAGETIHDTVQREVLEAACLKVEVGPLILATEYAPHQESIMSNQPPALTLIFACRPAKGKARLPDCPGAGQTAVRWVPADELDNIPLYPPVYKHILEYVYDAWRGIDLLPQKAPPR